MRRLEILPHQQRAWGNQGFVAVHQSVVVLQLRFGHERVQAGPGIDLARIEGLPAERVLQRHQGDVSRAETRRGQRAHEEDVGVGAWRGRYTFAFQIGQAVDG